MMNKAIKYARGSIWWIKDTYCKESWPGIQSGKRPVIIISNNERGASTVVEVCTLTCTNKSKCCPSINIPINIEGRVSYIQCNQHKTLSLSCFDSYYATVTAEAMQEIEFGLLRAQGMAHYIPNLLHRIEPDYKLDETSEHSEGSSADSSPKRRRNKWTSELISEFLSDKQVLSDSELMAKYNFSSPHSIKTAYDRFKGK